MAAAGSITLILPNTEKTREILKDIENKANDWLIKHFYGETSISFAYIEMSASDFVSGLDTAGTALAKKLEKAKYHKIPEKVFGIAENYFGPGDVPCPYCGKRPAHSSGAKCDICEDLARIGENIPKKIQTSLNVKIFDECCEVRSQDYDSLYVPKDDRGGIKTFDKIAESLSEKGIEALAVFKADVDNLGKLFRSAAKKGGMSRQASLSRILDSFWTLWLPDELKNNARFNNIYTVFSGGDDLFLIGKWDEIIDFSVYLRTKFLEFVCNSPCVTFSAGIALLKCGEPVQKFYEFSEDALETSKAFESGSLSKNALTLFGETISWTRLEELKECDSYIAGLIENCRINSAALQKIMEFISMADKTDEINGRIRRNEKVRYSEMSCFKWKRCFLISYPAMMP